MPRGERWTWIESGEKAKRSQLNFHQVSLPRDKTCLKSGFKSSVQQGYITVSTVPLTGWVLETLCLTTYPHPTGIRGFHRMFAMFIFPTCWRTAVVASLWMKNIFRFICNIQLISWVKGEQLKETCKHVWLRQTSGHLFEVKRLCFSSSLSFRVWLPPIHLPPLLTSVHLSPIL